MVRSSRTMLRLTCLLAALAAAAAAPAQSLTNGGFEDALDFNSWTVERAFSGSLLVCDSNPANAHGGNRSAHFGAHEGQPDVLSKHVATTPGMTYRVSFWLASDNIAPIYDRFVVTWGDEVLLEINPQQGFAYTRYVYDRITVAPSTELTFLGYKRFGTFRLDDVNVSLAPASDDCGSGPFLLPNRSYTGDNFDATNDVNPFFCGLIGGPDVWYRMVAPCNTVLSLNTCGSDFDTTLSVWSGECGSLTLVSCNDNSGGAGPCPGGIASNLDVSVSAGTIYYIRIAGASLFTRGNYMLNVSMPVPPNDDCAQPTTVYVNSTVHDDLSCATTDGSAGCIPTTNRDLWYSYTPTCDHMLQVDTCDTPLDTVLTVFTGECGGLELVDCVDDAPGICANNFASRLELPVLAGQRYLIRVSRFGVGPAGPVTLNVRSLDPMHDTCATALPIGEGATEFDGRCANSTAGQFCEQETGTAGKWFSYVAPCTGPVQVEYCDTAATDQAFLSVFVGDCSMLMCAGVNGLLSTSDCPLNTFAFSFHADAGQTYRICYTQAGGAYGPGTITIRQDRPANDACADAQPITDGTYTGSTACATPDGFSMCDFYSDVSASVWFTYRPTCPGTLTLDTCGSNYDSVVSVFRGGCGALEELTCNDEDPQACPPALQVSRVSMQVVANQVYTIRLSGYDGASGDYSLTALFTGAAGDSCASAVPFDGGTIDVNPLCATGGGRYCDTTIDGPGLWYEYTPDCSGPKTLTFCRTGGPPRGLFSVFTGDCKSLECVASRNLTSLPQFCPSGVNVLTFNADAGTTYRICYTQFPGTELGQGRLTIIDGPANDQCATAMTISPDSVNFNSQCGAMDASGTPMSCGGADLPAQWFRYEAACTAQVLIDLCGTPSDTVVAVYGGSCGSLVELGCNDDSPDGICPESPLSSYLEFSAQIGQTYLIRVAASSEPAVIGRMTIRCLISCPADINRDGLINLTDLSILLAHFGLRDAWHEDGDITGDARVDLTDLSILLANFGLPCGG